VFGRAAPGVVINRVAIHPQADDECGFMRWRLHDLEVDHVFAQHHQFRSFLNSRRVRSSNRVVSVRCHALRHSAATWARAGGARLDAIAGMLGHTSVTTTGVYAKIVDKIAENPARYLEKLMGLS